MRCRRIDSSLDPAARPAVGIDQARRFVISCRGQSDMARQCTKWKFNRRLCLAFAPLLSICESYLLTNIYITYENILFGHHVLQDCI